MITIGSKAIKYYFPDFPRYPKDLDVIVMEDEDIQPLESGQRVELLRNPVIEKLYAHCDDVKLIPNHIYTLKMSHMFWNINWEKHMFDIQFLLKKGCKLDLDLFHKLYDHWNVIHGKNKRSDLKMSADDFFDNSLKSEYDHDFLHILINPSPTYKKILIGEVEVSEEKFKELTYQEKCDLVSEEVMVMAFERYHNVNYKNAYSRMLKKFIISHAPIWEAIFIIENYIELHTPKFNYKTKIENGLQKVK